MIETHELPDIMGFEDTTGLLRLVAMPCLVVSVEDLIGSSRDVGGLVVETTYSLGDDASGVSRTRTNCKRDYASCSCKAGSTGMVCGALNFKRVGPGSGAVESMNVDCGKFPGIVAIGE